MSDDLIVSALLRISVISVLSAMAEPAAMTLNKSDLVESCYSAAETSKFTLNTSGLALLLIVNEYNILSITICSAANSPVWTYKSISY